jgi:hypothetical protein
MCKSKIFQLEKKNKMYRNRAESVKPKIRVRKLRQNINFQEVLKQKGVKQNLVVLCWERRPCHTLEKRHTERVRSVKYKGVNSVSAMHILRNQNTRCEAEDVMTELNYI